jgi:pimeloyl-ACP methyl ester carboxylesterase
MGLALDYYAWRNQIEYFNLFEDEFSVCAPDNRGVGLSDVRFVPQNTSHFECILVRDTAPMPGSNVSITGSRRTLPNK